MNLYIKKDFLVCSYNFHDMLTFTLCSLLCHSIFATNNLLPTPPDKASLVLQNKITSSPLRWTRPVLCFKQNSLFLLLLDCPICLFFRTESTPSSELQLYSENGRPLCCTLRKWKQNFHSAKKAKKTNLVRGQEPSGLLITFIS